MRYCLVCDCWFITDSDQAAVHRKAHRRVPDDPFEPTEDQYERHLNRLPRSAR